MKIKNLTILTDSQTLIKLPNRRDKILERKKQNLKELNLMALYESFFALEKFYKIKWVKLKGHKRKADKDRLDLIFSLVDKASRASLRKLNKVSKALE